MFANLRLNITQKFVAYLMVFSVIPLVVVGWVSSTTASRQLRDEIDRNSRQIVTDQLDYLELQQSQIESLLVNLSGVESVRDALDADNVGTDSYTRLSTQAQIGYILNGYINIEGLVSIDLFTVGGTHYTVGDTLVSDVPRSDVLDRTFDTAITNEGSVVWVGIEDNVNVSSRVPQVITAAMALYEFDREALQRVPIALLMVNFDPGELYEHFSRVDLGENGYLTVMDGQGRLIYHPDQDRIGTPADEALINRLAVSSTAQTLDTFDLDDEEVVASYAYSVPTGWTVAAVVPLQTISARISDIRNTIFIVLVVSFLVVAVVGFIYNRDVVAPIRAMIARFKLLQENPEQPPERLQPRGQDEVGQLVQWFNLFVDNLGERERLITELRVANQRAEEMTRLKSEFLATMSHELRTPLNAIEGFTSIMLSGMGITLEPKPRHMVERIQVNSQRLLTLINDVLDLSRIEAGRMELVCKPVNPRSLAAQWQQQLGILAERKGLRFQLTIDPELPYMLQLDENLLSKIVTNLLSNAIKFTQEGEIELALHSQDDTWTIMVRDTGIGISPHAQEIIFDEFRQADQSTTRKYQGSGLGLAIVQRLVRSMDGTITLKSEVDQGSTFTITLPLVKEEEKEPL